MTFDTLRRSVAPVCALLWLLPLVGCGANTGHVSGTVNYKGEKVPSGTVSFLSGGKIHEAEIVDGFYEISGLPVGEAKATVVRLDPNQPDPYETLNKVRNQIAAGKDAEPKRIDPGVVTDPLELDALQKKRHLLPYFYSSPETTDLRFTVVAGPNTFDIQLLDRPKSK